MASVKAGEIHGALPMTDNLQIVRRFFDDMCNARQLPLADRLFAAGHVYHDPGNAWVASGPQGMKDLIGAYHRAVADAHWAVNASIASGDIVVTRWTGTGTQTGELMGIPATGRKVKVDGIWMHRIAGGRIAESWNCWDMLGMLQQLGVVPQTSGMRSAA
jgi:steroid delta-isomerase-like uncharacterized protein